MLTYNNIEFTILKKVQFDNLPTFLVTCMEKFNFSRYINVSFSTFLFGLSELEE